MTFYLLQLAEIRNEVELEKIAEVGKKNGSVMRLEGPGGYQNVDAGK